MSILSRRDFFQKSGFAAAGIALPSSMTHRSDQIDNNPKIRRYKPFGKTGHMVSDISSGAGQREPGMIEHIFERGINLIDTAYQYPGHEEVIGSLFKAKPEWREKVFIVDKWDPEFVTPVTTKADLMEQLDVMLERLNTTYIDCLMIHALGHPYMGDITRIQNPAIYEAYDEAKKLGKIRFTGASSCGPTALEEFDWGIDNNRFDVILLGGNFLTKGAEPLLKKARAQGVATMAMKTMTLYKSGLNIRAFQNRETNARQAVLKWVLASDLFDTIIISMRNFDQVNEYLAVSGTTSLDADDTDNLETLTGVIGRQYCRPTCDACLGSCPHNVPIANVLRFKMYFENYGNEKYAMQRYNKIPAEQSAEMCAGCSGPCEESCTYKLPVRDLMVQAHTQLTMP
ncbi:aldo/keto reductase [candidate division KSB1 bacterium]